MRYQPAYVYPGTKPQNRNPLPSKPTWRFQRPRFQVEQSASIRLARFLMIIIGLLLVIVGLAHFVTAQMAQGWDQVSATITRSDVVRMAYKDGVPVFTAKIEYQYIKDGQLVTGSRLSLNPIRSQSPGEVKRQIGAYSVGRTVLAHVNPERPDKSYLYTNPIGYLQGLILPGLALIALSLLIGQAMYVHAERQQRKAWRFGDFKGPVAQPA